MPRCGRCDRDRTSRIVRVVVTGGAGFIGSRVCARLAAEDGVERIVAIDDLSTGYASNLDGIDAELIESSILDAGSMVSIIDGADAVIHLAARPSVPRSIADPIATHRVNLDGTVNVLEACRASGTRPFIIFAGSSSVYGANPILPKVETLAPLPRSPYAASKLAGEAYVRAWSESFGFPSLVFRFFNVFGPNQRPGSAYAAVIPAFLAAALQGEALPVHGDGSQTRDFTYVATVAEVIASAVLNTTSAPTPVNLAFGTRVALRSVVAEIESLLGKKVACEELPLRGGDVPHSQADNTLLRKLFPGVVPVDFVTGLRDTRDWMETFLFPSH